MIRCHKSLEAAGLLDSVRMVMNVHDALEFYVHASVSPQTVVDVLYPVIVAKTPWTQHWPVMVPEWHLWKRWGSPTELKLDENHQIIGLGGIIDIGTQEDDDDEEDGSAGTAVEQLSLSQAASRSAGMGDGHLDVSGHGPAVNGGVASHTGHVIVRVSEMPDAESVRRFLTMLAEFPGPNTMELVTPEGSVRVSAGTSLSPEDGAAKISLVLGGARVFWDSQSVSSDVLAAGLGL